MSESPVEPRVNVWRELTIQAVVVMEISWGVLWLQTFSSPLREVAALRIFVLFWATMLLAHLMARFLNSLKLKKNLHKGLVISFVLLCGWANLRILLAGSAGTQFTDFLTQPVEEVSAAGRLVPPEIWILVATLLLIWRGFSLAQSWGGRDTVFNSLLWGIGFYAVYGVSSALTYQTEALWLLYVFISAALLAMVTARVSTLVRMRGGTQSPFDRRWVSSILSAGAVVTGAAALVSGIISRQIEQLNGLFRWIVYGIVSLLVLPIAYLLKLGEPAIEAVQSIIATPTPAPQIPEWEQGLETAIGPEVLNELPESGGDLGGFFQAILIGGAFLVLMVLLLRLASSWQSRRESGLVDERQSLLAGTSLWDAFLNALRSRIFRTADEMTLAAKLRRKERLRAAARIRRIYADFMDLCSELGQPRPESVTPLEFIPAAMEVFPSLDDDLEEITTSYMRVRYGELPETNQEVTLVETAWKKISDQGLLMKKQARAQK